MFVIFKIRVLKRFDGITFFLMISYFQGWDFETKCKIYTIITFQYSSYNQHVNYHSIVTNYTKYKGSNYLLLTSNVICCFLTPCFCIGQNFKFCSSIQISGFIVFSLNGDIFDFYFLHFFLNKFFLVPVSFYHKTF